MSASEHPISRENVIAELDFQIQYATELLKGRRGNVRRSLMDWKSTLEDAKQSVVEGTITEEQVTALVDRGCRQAGAVRSNMTGHFADRPVWVVTGEDMANNVAIMQRLGDLLRTQINGTESSP